MCHVGLVLCSHIVGRATFMCVFFSPRIRLRRLVFPGVGPPCVLAKFSVPSHICFCVSILGSANDVLPLMVLCSVGCNTVEENNTYRPLCKVLWECRCLHGHTKKYVCCVAMTFSNALSCLHDFVFASAVLSGQCCIVVGPLCDVLSWPWCRSQGLRSV